MTTTTPVSLELVYHVPRSQVWEGSRGRARGNVHLHVSDDVALGRIRRQSGMPLCGEGRGWYERPPEYATEQLCPRCVAIAERHGLAVPQ